MMTDQVEKEGNMYLLLMVPVRGTWEKSQESAIQYSAYYHQLIDANKKSQESAIQYSAYYHQLIDANKKNQESAMQYSAYYHQLIDANKLRWTCSHQRLRPIDLPLHDIPSLNILIVKDAYPLVYPFSAWTDFWRQNLTATFAEIFFFFIKTVDP